MTDPCYIPPDFPAQFDPLTREIISAALTAFSFSRGVRKTPGQSFEAAALAAHRLLEKPESRGLAPDEFGKQVRVIAQGLEAIRRRGAWVNWIRDAEHRANNPERLALVAAHMIRLAARAATEPRDADAVFLYDNICDLAVSCACGCRGFDPYGYPLRFGDPLDRTGGDHDWKD
nr:MAG TPA: hypothetical protein [Caudoviricetes sp.]